MFLSLDQRPRTGAGGRVWRRRATQPPSNGRQENRSGERRRARVEARPAMARRDVRYDGRCQTLKRYSSRLVQPAGIDSRGSEYGVAARAATRHRQMLAVCRLGLATRCSVIYPGVAGPGLLRPLQARPGYLAMCRDAGQICPHQWHRQQMQQHGKGSEPDRRVTGSEHGERRSQMASGRRCIAPGCLCAAGTAIVGAPGKRRHAASSGRALAGRSLGLTGAPNAPHGAAGACPTDSPAR